MSDGSKLREYFNTNRLNDNIYGSDDGEPINDGNSINSINNDEYSIEESATEEFTEFNVFDKKEYYEKSFDKALEQTNENTKRRRLSKLNSSQRQKDNMAMQFDLSQVFYNAIERSSKGRNEIKKLLSKDFTSKDIEDKINNDEFGLYSQSVGSEIARELEKISGNGTGFCFICDKGTDLPDIDNELMNKFSEYILDQSKRGDIGIFCKKVSEFYDMYIRIPINNNGLEKIPNWTPLDVYRHFSTHKQSQESTKNVMTSKYKEIWNTVFENEIFKVPNHRFNNKMEYDKSDVIVSTEGIKKLELIQRLILGLERLPNDKGSKKRKFFDYATKKNNEVILPKTNIVHNKKNNDLLSNELLNTNSTFDKSFC
jgi:hypothetical protein